MLAELVRGARNNEAEGETGRAKGGDNLTFVGLGKWPIAACEACRCNRLLLSGYLQRRKEMAF